MRIAKTAKYIRRALDTWSPPFGSVELEADVLQGVGGLAVEPGGRPIVPASCRKIPLGDPRRRAMAPRRELVVCALTRREGHFGLVEAILLEQRAAQNELGVADLTDFVDPVTEKPERIACLLLCERDVTGSEVDLGDAVHRVRCLGVVADFEGDADCVLQEVHRLFRV